MPQAGVSVAPESLGIYDVWEEEVADEFVGDFRFPRRRITGGRGSAAGASAPTPRSAVRQAVSTESPRKDNGAVRARSQTERAPSAGRPARNGRAASPPDGATASARNGRAASPPEGVTRAPRPVRSGSAAPGFPPPAGGVPGRRTVTIRAHGAERDLAF